ncbi:hypothetical protein AB1N83_014320, partial [Pleurotus pulmonarius]
KGALRDRQEKDRNPLLS